MRQLSACLGYTLAILNLTVLVFLLERCYLRIQVGLLLDFMCKPKPTPLQYGIRIRLTLWLS